MRLSPTDPSTYAISKVRMFPLPCTPNCAPICKRATADQRLQLPEELKLFPDRADVLNYIGDTARRAEILPLIRFNTPVKHVEKAEGGWRVSTNDGEQIFSHVLVASGKDSCANIPKIDGLDSFEGPVTHSQSYRRPNQYEGKRVALIGACVSSEDISLDLSPHASEVYICGTFPPDGHKCYVRNGLYGEATTSANTRGQNALRGGRSPCRTGRC